jgi:hypothetical protein
MVRLAREDFRADGTNQSQVAEEAFFKARWVVLVQSCSAVDSVRMDCHQAPRMEQGRRMRIEGLPWIRPQKGLCRPPLYRERHSVTGR